MKKLKIYLGLAIISTLSFLSSCKKTDAVLEEIIKKDSLITNGAMIGESRFTPNKSTAEESTNGFVLTFGNGSSTIKLTTNSTSSGLYAIGGITPFRIEGVSASAILVSGNKTYTGISGSLNISISGTKIKGEYSFLAQSPDNSTVNVTNGVFPLINIDYTTIAGINTVPCVNTLLGIPDGFYISKTGSTPVAGEILRPEKEVSTSSVPQSREGFLSSFKLLENGYYSIHKVVEGKIEKTFGASLVSIDLSVQGSESGYDTALQGTTSETIDTFTVNTSGFYKVILDQLTSELLLYKIEYASIIGSATPGGWAKADTQKLAFKNPLLPNNVSFEISKISLEKGEYKIRFNDRWTIDRRTNNTNLDLSSGYVALINFGGTLANPELGGGNFSISTSDNAIYKYTLNWTPENQFSITRTKIADPPRIDFIPDNYNWGIIGAASIDWDTDSPFIYSGKSGNDYIWTGTFDLTSGDFRFRTNQLWNYYLTFSDVVITGDASYFSNNSGNFKVSTAGNYTFTLKALNPVSKSISWTLDIKKN